MKQNYLASGEFRSKWHFDTNRIAEPGKDSFTYVCRFNLTLDDSVKELINEHQRIPFPRVDAEHIELFQKVATYLGITTPAIKYHNQKPGQMLPTHIDNFTARIRKDNLIDPSLVHNNPDLMRRFVIMLSDWKIGQVFNFGNSSWTQWRAGDCVTWDWQDVPHGTCNIGFDDRPSFQITGYTTERTTQVMAEASIDKIVNV